MLQESKRVAVFVGSDCQDRVPVVSAAAVSPLAPDVAAPGPALILVAGDSVASCWVAGAVAILNAGDGIDVICPVSK